MDAFTQPWSFPVMYAFPPPNLVPAIISKFQRLEESVKPNVPRKLCLIAPCWQMSQSLPLFLDLVTEIPKRLRFRKGLGKNPGVIQSSEHIKASSNPVDIIRQTSKRVALSIKKSSAQTYSTAWQAWYRWCRTNDMDSLPFM